MYLVKLSLSRHEREGLSLIFEGIDEDRDCVVSMRDIVKYFKDKFGMQISDEVYDKVEKQFGKKGGGGIGYTEFLMAGCNKNVILSEANLKHLYAYIDTSGNGLLSREEVKTFLGVNDDTYIGIIVEDADDDCDGGISFKEF